MQDIEVTDEWLYKYMPIVDEAIIRSLEENMGNAIEFSDHFETGMEQMIRREAKPWFAILNGVRKRASMIVVAIVSALLLTTLSVSANWYKVFVTSTEAVPGGWNEYRYTLTADTEERKARELQNVPEGYDEIERTLDDGGFSVIYENDLGEWIVWDQNFIVNRSALTLVLDAEYDDMVVTQINGADLIIYIYPYGKTAYFEYGNNVFVALIDNMELEDIYKMFQCTFQTE